MNKKRINEFLENIEYMYDTRLNTDTPLTQDEVYSWLVRLDNGDDHKDLSDFITYWLDYYNDKDNINGYYDNKFFCILENGEWKSNDYTIKCYIPFRYHDIKEGAKKVFDYLSDNNINHLSKITKYMRSDTVIVRLKSIRDVKNLIDFIDNSIVHDMEEELNPFTFSYHGIGLVMDNNLSYNYEVAKVIYNYVLSRKLFKQNDKPNYREFYNFVYNCYKDATDNNVKMIYDMLYASLDKEYNIQDFYDKVSLYQGNPTLLFESLLATRNKYRKNEQAVNSLLLLLKGNYSGITRKNNYRNRLYQYMDSDMIKRTICSMVNRDKDSEMTDEILSLFLKELNRYSLSGTLSRSIGYAVLKTLVKIDNYNELEARNLISTLLDTKNIYLLTRDNGARDLVLSKTNKNDLLSDLREELGPISNEEMVDKIIEKMEFDL